MNKVRPIRLLVCGGRNFTDQAMMDRCLDALTSIVGVGLVIHGDYKGADKCADKWARSRNHPVQPVPADWKRHGASAGPKRNRQMLAMNPDIVVTFPSSGPGTADMKRISHDAGIKVIAVDEYGNMIVDE